jgi:hypothetical protein
MEWFGYLVAVIVTIWGVISAFRSHMKDGDRWSEFALNNGLEPNKTVLGPHAMNGVWAGVEVEVTDLRTGKRGEFSTTKYVARFSQPVPDGLFISPEGFMGGMGFVNTLRKWRGYKDIAIGDPEFDEEVFVTGRDEAGIRRLLDDPAVRASVWELVTEYEGKVDHDKGVIMNTDGTDMDGDVIQTKISVVVAVASAIQRAHARCGSGLSGELSGKWKEEGGAT